MLIELSPETSAWLKERSLNMTPESPPPRSRMGATLLALVTILVGVLVYRVANAPSESAQNAVAYSPSGQGWTTNADGVVHTTGGAPFLGSVSGPLKAPIVGIAPTADGKGYWVAAANGTVYSFGDAANLGSLPSSNNSGKIVGIVANTTAGGYQLIAANGSEYDFTPATFSTSGNTAPTSSTTVAAPTADPITDPSQSTTPTTTVTGPASSDTTLDGGQTITPTQTTAAPTPVTTAAPVETPTTAVVVPTTAAPPAITAPPAQTVPTTVPAAPVEVQSSGQVNSVDDVIADMTNPNEAHPHGVPSDYNWYSGPVLYSGANSPSSAYHAITMWGQVYEAAQGSSASNVRIELRAAQCWVWSISQSKWIEVLYTTGVQGAHFEEDFATNNAVSADLRTEADGGTSTTMIPDYNFHFWPTGNRATIDPSDVGGVYTTVQARLVQDDPSGVNDLSAANYLVNVGADYWTTTTSAYPNNTAVFEGRFDYVTPQWQAFNAISWTPSQVLANPPPVADAPTS